MVRLYSYKCRCGEGFDAFRCMDERQSAPCPKCGSLASKVISVINQTYRWVLSEQSHERFAKDEFVRDRG